MTAKRIIDIEDLPLVDAGEGNAFVARITGPLLGSTGHAAR
jgi:hypothetical protein